MKIAVSIEHIKGRKTGVGQYAFNLLCAALEIDKTNSYYLLSPYPLAPNDKVLLMEYKNLSILETNIFAKVLSSPALVVALWVQFQIPWLLLNLKPDVFFHTGAVWPIVPIPAAKKSHVFIHDVIQLKFPQYFRKHSYYFYWAARKINMAFFGKALVNSETTKDDVVEKLKFPCSRVFVTPLGKNEKFVRVGDSARIAACRLKYNLPEKFVLFTGTMEPRKNLVRLLAAYAKSGIRDTCGLVIVGKKGWMYKDIFAAAKRFGIEANVVFAGYVDDDELPVFYSMATVFVYPSLYEGFGLPVLEAMACGVPVITSNISSLPEVAGDAAILINPEGVDEMSDAIRRVVNDECLASRLRQASVKRSSQFSWDRTARLTLDFLDIPWKDS